MVKGENINIIIFIIAVNFNQGDVDLFLSGRFWQIIEDVNEFPLLV